MRSLATRQANLALSKSVQESIDICKAAGYDLIIVETSGIGQSDTEITEHCDVALYVMTPEFGAATQLEKIDMLDFADIVAINKFDKKGAPDALRDVKKQYQRNHNAWTQQPDEMPVFGTIASQFNDPGMNSLYRAIMDKLVTKTGTSLQSTMQVSTEQSEKIYLIPPQRNRYLAEIVENNQQYDEYVRQQSAIASQLYQVHGTLQLVGDSDASVKAHLTALYQKLEEDLSGESRRVLKEWPEIVKRYEADEFVYKVRDKEVRQPLKTESLSRLKIPKVSLPRFSNWGDILRWVLSENVPGSFPYAGGVFS